MLAIILYTAISYCIINLQSHDCEQILHSSDIVVVYKKGCPYSEAALRTLGQNNYDFVSIEKEENPTLAGYIKANYYPKYPAIFVRGNFFGGNDTLQQALSQGTFSVKPKYQKNNFDTSEN